MPNQKKKKVFYILDIFISFMHNIHTYIYMNHFLETTE